jgi:hypothetical protein
VIGRRVSMPAPEASPRARSMNSPPTWRDSRWPPATAGGRRILVVAVFTSVAVNRRKVLGGAGLAGAAAATGAGVDRLITGGTSGYRTDKAEPMDDDAARFGDPRLPAETITSESHLFHLGAQPPTTLDGGSFQRRSRR